MAEAVLELIPEFLNCDSVLDMVERHGAECLWMNSACDWGVRQPLSIPYTAMELTKRDHDPDAVDRLIYRNPLKFLSPCPKFRLNQGN